ncbi:hypothetical protein PPTG_02128 [Phytophthora nicotianae INRA-310]|uniref:ZSWIM3 N-terminal domain-containing protein n=2 Tax=Phytophthora nicotianae TaxID=4792 RepID=W2RBK9_PHYN3|nr:hypothetical protein PPTG_02128 [Phytophthora nicotianae INRA-310]ETN22084.1 hypothetical protein PPTG_02128 [Phytophthora nicotianae INRA-310]
MPRRHRDDSVEDDTSVSSSSSDSEVRDNAAPTNSRSKKKRVRRRSSVRERGKKFKRRKHSPRRLSSCHHSSSSRRRTDFPEALDSSAESQHGGVCVCGQIPSESEEEERNGGDVAPLDTLVNVPELDVTPFDSWDALESYLKAYSKRTFQVYSIRTNTPVRTRNARMQRTMSTAKPIPEELKFYNKNYVCTHYGEPRHNRGQGMRPNPRRIGCKAQINACVHFGADWEIVFMKQNTGHNPEVGRELYQNYHEARQVSDTAFLDSVRTLHRAGANRKRILEYVMENTDAEPTMKDIHNWSSV